MHNRLRLVRTLESDDTSNSKYSIIHFVDFVSETHKIQMKSLHVFLLVFILIFYIRFRVIASCLSYLPILTYTPPAFVALVVVIPFDFCGDLWRQKTRVPGLSCGVVCLILRLAIFVKHRLTTDRQTDTRRQHIYRADIASHAKTSKRLITDRPATWRSTQKILSKYRRGHPYQER